MKNVRNLKVLIIHRSEKAKCKIFDKIKFLVKSKDLSKKNLTLSVASTVSGAHFRVKVFDFMLPDRKCCDNVAVLLFPGDREPISQI